MKIIGCPKSIIRGWCARLVLSCACLLVLWTLACFTTGLAQAEPQAMTDSELDTVTARGAVDEEELSSVLDLGGLLGSANPDGPGALFSFNLGNLLGNGSIDFSGLSGGSALTLNGDINTQILNVENLILNLNICAGCNGTIYQTGLGVPIKVIQPAVQ